MEFYEHKICRVEDLIPYALNSRTHSDAQVAQIAASIREFGFTNPVLVDPDRNLIAGHGRVLAARKLGLADVPAVVVTGLDDRKRRALIIADNKLALNAGWDEEALKIELEDLGAEFGDLMGFSSDELAALLMGTGSGETDPDAVPDVPVVPVTVPGDLWLLGSHKVLCGDSTMVDHVERLMGSERADACWTDPPYNVAYEGTAGKIKNDDMSDAKFREFLYAAYTNMFLALKDGAAIYVAHADTEGLNFRGAFKDAGFKLSSCIIWRKDSLVLGRSDYQWQHEPILYGWKPGSRHRWYGGRKQTTVQEAGDGSPFSQLPDGRWVVRVGDRALIVDGTAQVEEVVPSVINEGKPKRSSEHPTMKPVVLIERMLKHSARPGDLVLDLFGGSGSTLVAADRLGMCGRLMELDPKFCDVIVQRWQDYTGREAVHAETGKPFSKMKASRNG